MPFRVVRLRVPPWLFLFILAPAKVAPVLVPSQGGAELFLDGVDDFFVAFPGFDVAMNWTLEAWVEQPELSEFDGQQCLMHQATYSATNLLTLSADFKSWSVRYGEHEIIVPRFLTMGNASNSSNLSNISNASNSSNLSNVSNFSDGWSPDTFVRPLRQEHIAISHLVPTSSAEVNLTVFVNGVVAAEANLPQPELFDPPLAFMVGACHSLVRNGIVRSWHFLGHLDEVRWWSSARSASEVVEALDYSGLVSEWPAGIDSASLAAQYNFDKLSELEIIDSSGSGNHGIRGGGGMPGEMPVYQPSVFGGLRLGVHYYEVLTTLSEDFGCPSLNCLQLAPLLVGDGSVSYNAFLIEAVPVGGVAYLTAFGGNGSRLMQGDLVNSTDFLLHAQAAVQWDSFKLQLCRGNSSEVPSVGRCVGQPVHTFAFRVLENQPPMAGEAYSLHLLGDSGFLELHEHLAESGTLEFWSRLPSLNGVQTIFSVSRRDLGKPTWRLKVPVLTLRVTDGDATLEVCTAPMTGDEQPYTQMIPELASTEAQHIAVSWEYVRAARGRAVYLFRVYRNCTLVAGPITVEDSCVHFGYKDTDLHFPTFGQQYDVSPAGLTSSALAEVHLADIRLWTQPLQSQKLCNGMTALLSGSEAGLQAQFPMGPEDARRGDGTLGNKLVGGHPADLRCSSARLACPYASKLRGYILRPSVFELPSQSVSLVTSAGYVSSVDGGRLLPPLEVAMPASDRDKFATNNVAGHLDASEVRVRVTHLPNVSCGTLLANSSNVSVGQTFTASELPLYFEPARPLGSDVDSIECQTSTSYVALDSRGVESPFGALINIAVKVTGPRVDKVELIEPGLSDDGPDVGDIIAVTFDRPTNRALQWRNAFQVIDGSLGRTEFVPMWNDAGDVLMLQIAGHVGTYADKVISGSCGDHGLLPILTLEECESAAYHIGLADFSVTIVSEIESPEGCWFLDGQSLYLNTNPASQGKGTETSTPGFPRLPICTLPGLNLQEGVTRFDFLGSLEASLQTGGEDSYPVADLSPHLQGSFSQSFCSNGTVFKPRNASCLPCGLGFSRTPDGLGCEPCPAGTVAPSPNMLACEACELGKYLPTDSASRDQCVEAPPGQYVDHMGAVRALDCPQGSVAERNGSSVCERCPEGANCEQHPPRTFAEPLPSYFRTEAGSIVACALPLACQGWDATLQSNACAEGMGGYLCQSCLTGYWRPHDKSFAACSQCGWQSPAQFLIVLALQSIVVWIIGVISIDAACWGNMHSVILRLALNYFSAVSVLSRLEEWELEAALGGSFVKAVVQSLNALFRFDGGVTAHLMGLECWLGRLVGPSEGPWPALQATTLLWILMPLLWPLSLVLSSLFIFEGFTQWRRLAKMIHNDPVKGETFASLGAVATDEFIRERRLLGLVRIRAAQCRCCDRWSLVVRDSLPLILIGQFLLLPTMLRQCALVLTCDTFGGDGEKRLFVAPQVVCWRGSHLAWASAAMSAVVVWGVLLPLVLMLIIWKWRDRIFEDVKLRALVGFLSDGYEPRWACWEVVVYSRKLMIILISAWPDLTRLAEMAFYQVIGVAAVLLHYAVKPFDNRSGELLDRVELYGLCLFLLQVTFVQFVLLADPQSEHDLLSVLVTSMLLAAASVVMVAQRSSSRLYGSVCLVGFFLVLTVMYVFASGEDNRKLTAFLILGLAIVLNACYICWLLAKILRQLCEAVAEVLARRRVAEQQEFLKEASKDAVQLALTARTMLAESMPFGTLVSKPAMPKISGRTLLGKLQHAVMDAHFDTAGARIWFDAQTSELVLGLHPDKFSNDPNISSYMRRKLAAAGPFLTDDERSFVAMGLRDALMHLIVECDTNTVHCTLLEFLIRAAFAWHARQERKEREALTSQEPESVTVAEDDSPEAFMTQLFDEKTFQHSMTAADFQAHMEKFTKFPKEKVVALVGAFLQIRATRAG